MEPERNKIQTPFRFPMRQTAAVADCHGSKAGARRPRNSRRDAGATLTVGTQSALIVSHPNRSAYFCMIPVVFFFSCAKCACISS
jgi:hypothetical protein